ncbi:hypothetical protein EMIHUDRAFT_439179 [Emiliania huxleyi CCMP1516]|uniref:RING-type domain-containing protein n=2 Tax=Emiliania huxleyi TaxID=2903 RepID=A0A0D3HZA1_EMIH1|nr:hypothetical protein EMIHUDRAFT_439179 [Emiliania huxleyi CCMP1516]EOD04336.1 hypothetical protein EMIHUDRAFT_439179 [Emiliania huxleyi CCMP1516]|eukprot:XP_005756765.1 hypothetical protein EMIHUDRAFT_439179 [Emiliania huxleyi CCMP1516]
MFDTSMRLTWPRWPSSASSNNGDESPGDDLGATSPMSCGGDGAATAGGPDEVVEVFKPRAGIRIGISLMRSCPAHPTVRTVLPGSLAAQRRSDGSDAPIISTFDRILAINGDKPRTARDAAAMIRDAQGCVRIRLLRKPPVFVADSALKLQRRWRQRRGSRIEIVWKAAAAAAVGVAFSDALEDAAVVASVVPNSLASDAALHPGDRLVAVDAKHVGSPREAAEMLRQARGAVALTVVEAARVDQDALLASERRRRAAEADGTAEPCALCLEVPRSELVAWPAGCEHHFCARCTYKALDFGIRACPLCRAEKPRLHADEA